MYFSPPGFQHFDYTKLLPKILKEVPELQNIVLVDDLANKYHAPEGSYHSYEKFIDNTSW